MALCQVGATQNLENSSSLVEKPVFLQSLSVSPPPSLSVPTPSFSLSLCLDYCTLFPTLGTHSHTSSHLASSLPCASGAVVNRKPPKVPGSRSGRARSPSPGILESTPGFHCFGWILILNALGGVGRGLGHWLGTTSVPPLGPWVLS